MTEQKVTLQQLTRDELAFFLAPEVLENTLASLKLVYEVTWTIKVWRGTFIQFEPRGEMQRWMFENRDVVNAFTVNLVTAWKKCQQSSQPGNSGFTDSYDQKLNCDEYTYRCCCTPLSGVTEEAVLTVQRHIIKR